MALTDYQEIGLAASDNFQKTLCKFLDDVRNADEIKHDQRFLSIAATQFELGFMALNKAIANPENGISTER